MTVSLLFFPGFIRFIINNIWWRSCNAPLASDAGMGDQLHVCMYAYIYLEPKWPLFWLEKALFWRVDLQNRGQLGSRFIFLLITWLFDYIWYIHLQATGDSSPCFNLNQVVLKGGHKKTLLPRTSSTFNWAMNKQTPGCLGTFWGWNTYIPSQDGIITSKYKDPFKYCVLTMFKIWLLL